ncbi:MAG: hypothetical protein K0S35_1954 [Geminicoccaceae bacterium]|nr:hypothetical protein [Geminicoccaceae bacterium]
MSGQLVDASIVAAPKQRNTEAEKQAIKDGRVPQEWQHRPAKLRQKDRAARWTVKTTKAKPRAGETPLVDLAIPAFGYQNHISADRRHRLIRRWLVTDAAAHAGARLADLLDPDNTAAGVWADTGPADAGEPHPPEEAGGPADAGAHRPGQREEVGGAGPHRARLRRAEGPDGPVRPDHRSRSGDDQDRACQSGHQHAPPALAATPAGARLTRRWPANATKASPRLTKQPIIRPPRTPLADLNTHPPANGR